MGTSPEGTAETRCGSSAVPPRLIGLRRRVPNVETLGYYQMSLRDKNLARSGVSCGSKSWRYWTSVLPHCLNRH